ncbi:MAG: hypothetical protein O2919_02930 [Chloroflexi bacterium]|nr:hypothetical protein [Chloroflexota bacterium]
MPARRARWLAASLAALGGLGLVLGAVAVRDRQAGDGFDVVRWQIDQVPGKALQVIGAPFRNDPDPDEAIRRYFALDPTSEEARELENVVEAAIEGRIDRVLREFGVSARVPLPGSVTPPVNIELATTPRVLVASPRAEVRRDRAVLLRPDLVLAEAERIEASTEDADPAVSALVVPSGGVAAYPAVVINRGTYASVVATAAHEWVHHYLAFYPLGIRYFASADLRTINETVADLIGDEVAADVLARWGDPTALDAVLPPALTPTPAIDRNMVLRDLRLEVDDLLAAGQIAEAEARMEVVRLELWEAGVQIRRINQAYFAWFGSYAARPDTVDPIGAQLREVRERSSSLSEFVERVRGLTSRADVEALHAQLTGAVTDGANR